MTSHPDVACDMCGRRLLRGEQPEQFLGGGQRRLVCELCTTRAAQEGWRRETEEHPGRPRVERPARGSSLLRRLRQLREPARPVRAELQGVGGTPTAEPADGAGGTAAEGGWTRIDSEWAAMDEDWGAPGAADAVIESATPEGALVGRTAGEHAVERTADGDGRTASNHGDEHVMRALEVFNAGEYPRRLAGVARALGAPTVRATRLESETVAIVVAWELCWYRYEVDHTDAARGAWLAAEGMELEELTEQDRVANAALDDHGKVALLVS